MSIVEIPPGSGNRYRYEYENGKTQYKGPVGEAPELGEAEFMERMAGKNVSYTTRVRRLKSEYKTAIYGIYDGRKRIGHIAGFEYVGDSKKFKEQVGIDNINLIAIWNTELDELYRGQGRYQDALRQIISDYENGIVVEKFQASTALQKSLRKMENVKETEDFFHIPQKK